MKVCLFRYYHINLILSYGYHALSSKKHMIKYRVTLTKEEAGQLSTIISKVSHTAQQYRNPYILLNCDDSGREEKMINAQASRMLKVSMPDS